MKCPLCSIDLAITHRDGVEIDYCPKCRGAWLDRGELDKLIEMSAATSARSGPELPDRHRDYDDYQRAKYPKKRESWLSKILDFD